MSSETKGNEGGRKALFRGWVFACALAAVVLVGGGFWLTRYAADPRNPFLASHGGAEWIRYNEEVSLLARPVEDAISGFRTRFWVPSGTRGTLLLKAMKAANVFVDGKLAFSDGLERGGWKKLRQIDLGGLPAGEHELKVLVVNDSGPPCLLAWWRPELGTMTRADQGTECAYSWESSNDGQTWSPAVTVGAYRPSGLSRKFARADQALLRSLPLLLFAFAVAAVWSLALDSDWGMSARVRRATPGAGTFRWLLMGAVGLMAVNNIFRLPFYYGFDLKGHIEYIHLVAHQYRIPLPTEGWTMFQAPLYYVLSAPLYRAATALFEQERAVQALRLLTLPCALAQVELAYRAGRRLFRDREGLQMAATTVGGLLPASLYMSQYVGNEPLAGVLVGLVLVLGLRFYYEPERGRTPAALGLMGLALGLALLSKLTALFLIPPLAALIAYGIWTARGDRLVRRLATGFLLVFGTAAIVGGWYYARNYFALGRAFWGGWEPERGITWWQDPGYRTLWQLVPAGEALVYPVCSSLVSFWDGFYSTLWADGYIGSTTDASYAPPWNYSLMLGGLLLALIPTGAILTGAGAAVRRRPERVGLVFLGGTLALYVAMMVYGFLSLPYYCITKGSYTLGLACAYGALAAAGFGMLARGKLSRAMLAGLLSAWAAAAYGAYFVVG